MTPPILRLPTELAVRILSFCDARDLAWFSQTCVLARDLIYGAEDQCLWREVFLKTYDDPRQALRVYPTDLESSSAVCVDWKKELQRRIRAHLDASSTSHSSHPVENGTSERTSTLETFLTVIHEALPIRNVEPGDEHPHESHNILWLDQVLRESRILDSDITPCSHKVAGLYARLRSYVALTYDEGELDEDREGALRDRRTKSRTFVYDLRNYHMENDWAPFMVDGKSNWEHVEHLINVVLMNLRELPSLWTKRPPLGLQATRAFSAPDLKGGEDWAGVEGTWRRYVCFMDYRDLFAFNFSNVASGPRSPIFFEDKRFREATRLIEVKLHLVPKEKLRYHDRFIPEPRTCNSLYPTLYFAGTSRGVSGSEANIEGNVRIGLDGCVRWQFRDIVQATIYDGSTHWSSHGVQIGGIASAAGILGNWTTILHDQGDPVGPFWLWKVAENNAPGLMDFT